MITLLIADDEFHIRNGILQFVPWKELSIEAVVEAADGLAALSMYEQAKPNVLLLDINMPGISGLEVGRRIREKDPDAQIIFLTGYDDFDKAKEAISLQASDYLLKPVAYGELVQALSKASCKIAEVLEKNEYVVHLERKIHEFSPAASERILLDWLQHQRSPSEAEALLSDLGVVIPLHAPYLIYAVEIDDFHRYMDDVSQRDRDLYLYAYKKLAQEVFESAGRTAHVIHFSPSRLIIIVVLGDRILAETEWNADAERLKEAYRNYLKLSITIGVSRPADNAVGLPAAYREAVMAVDHRSYVGGGITIPYRLVEPAVVSGKRLLGKELYLMSEIRSGNDTNVINTLTEWCEELRELPLPDAKMIASQLLLFVMRLMKEAEVKVDAIHADPIGSVMKCETSKEVTGHVTSFVMEVGKAIHSVKNRPSMKVMEKAKQWIRQHLAEEINLTKLAGYLHMSPNYVSTLFKQSTGETFIEFVTRMRFERAKELLSDPGLKMHEISASIGFTDANYFSIAFKKHHGISPSEFRQRYY